MDKRNFFLILHQSYLKLILALTSSTEDFGLKVGFLSRIFDKFVSVYGSIAFSTNFIKAVRSHKPAQVKGEANATSLLTTMEVVKPCEVHGATWLQIMMLDYIPCIASYGKFYHGFIAVMFGITLSWRLYQVHFKSRDGKWATNCLEEKKKLLIFFINGYSLREQQPRIKPADDQLTGSKDPWILLPEPKRMRPPADKDPRTGRRRVNRRTGLLAAIPSLQLDWLVGGDACNSPENWFDPILRYEQLLAGGNGDNSLHYWNYLSKFFYSYELFKILLVVIVLIYIWPAHTMVVINYSGQDSYKPVRVNYGLFEVGFMLFQATTFLMSHQIVLLIYADIRYNYNNITHGLDYLSTCCSMGRPIDQRREYFEQLRVWHHFNKVIRMDDFVRGLSFMHMLMLIPGVAYGVCFIWIGDSPIRVASAAMLPGTILPFAISCFLSSDIQRQNQVIDKKIRDLQSMHSTSEPCPVVKDLWKRIRRGFLSQSNLVYLVTPIFTIANMHNFTLDRMFFVVFVLLGEGVIVSRVLHSLGGWDTVFNTISANTTNLTQ